MNRFKNLRISIICQNLLIISFAFSLLFFSGCVGSKKYAAVESERDQLQSELSDCRQSNSSLQSRLDEAQQETEEISRLESEISDLENQLNVANQKLRELNNQKTDCPENMTEGVYFKVQIGAFRERELSEDLDQSVNLGIEEEGGLTEIVVGQFRDYYAADELQNQLRAMGVKDAWIVPYRDGQRVPLDEVLDTVQE